MTLRQEKLRPVPAGGAARWGVAMPALGPWRRGLCGNPGSAAAGLGAQRDEGLQERVLVGAGGGRQLYICFNTCAPPKPAHVWPPQDTEPQGWKGL